MVRRVRAVLAVVCSFVLVYGWTSAAAASNFDRYFADSYIHVFTYEDLTDLVKRGIRATRDNSYDPTDMYTYNDSDHNFADVASYDSHYSDEEWYGLASCVTANGDECSHWHIQYNLKYIDTFDEAWHLACHEIGHSVGLKHRPPNEDADLGCMARPSDNYLKIHNITHLNNRY